MNDILTYNEAREIFDVINDNLDRTDENIVELYQDMISRAVRYANIRAGWNILTREQKLEQDASRTSAHDAFIMSVNIIARTQGDTGAAWRQRLSDERKRIGDFACYIALFEGIEAR